MDQVKRISNWGYWDELDGKELEEGEALTVIFPRARVPMRMVVKIIEQRNNTSDMGSSTTISARTAYGEFELWGVCVLLQLNIKGVLCERVTSDRPAVDVPTVGRLQDGRVIHAGDKLFASAGGGVRIKRSEHAPHSDHAVAMANKENAEVCEQCGGTGEAKEAKVSTSAADEE
jgi:hypothetical protein